MPRYARERRTDRPRGLRGEGRALEPSHPLLALQRSAGNRAVAGLLARSALQRQNGGGGGGQPGGVSDVPIGQPPPVTVSPGEVAAGPQAPPGNVTYTGVGSSPPAPTGGGPAPTQQPAPSGGGAATPAVPSTTPATTTATAPPQDDSTPHLDPTLTLDPFNLTLTYTIADLHAWRSRGRLVDIDFLADPSASLSLSLDPSHAVAGQAAVNIFLMHIKQNGDSVVDLGFGPSLAYDGSNLTASGQATAELHLTEHGSLTFTATVTPTSDGHGGYGLNASAVVGTVWHFN
jgi:hypothetical protein